ncbi:Hsp20/alpha crystallin family protein [Streptomyces spectabilis]|uniref:Hsp20/alpha crystallin family protein n=1 Tax=Streptomyces spectabilis TaxID=68270 RepID=A0A516R1A8_STRST|nr:Hsp20/alpha crystallin family protein [Streptomyces spectabilis]QDQ09444.1 Hsp20/alpha crystallin family protein [Streptomyces spectabilis]
MTNLLEWRPPVLPDVFDWLESGLTGRPTWRTGPSVHGIRIEEQLTDDAYRVLAELPGLDPEEDVEISVTQGVLTLRAERSEQTERGHHSEFRYGSFVRAVRLPAGAREDEIKAEYKDGILIVTVPLTAAKKTGGKTIPVHRVTG